MNLLSLLAKQLDWVGSDFDPEAKTGCRDQKMQRLHLSGVSARIKEVAVLEELLLDVSRRVVEKHGFRSKEVRALYDAIVSLEGGSKWARACHPASESKYKSRRKNF